MTTRGDIVREARAWLGVKWQHQGRTRYGIDCIGLLQKTALELGLIDSMAPARYGRRPDGTLLAQIREAGLTEVPVGKAQPGDIAVFSRAGEPFHLGIMTSRGGVASVVHAYADGRQVREENLAGIPPEFGFMTHAFLFPGIE